jgi:hypothetical protein
LSQVGEAEIDEDVSLELVIEGEVLGVGKVAMIARLC